MAIGIAAALLVALLLWWHLKKKPTPAAKPFSGNIDNNNGEAQPLARASNPFASEKSPGASGNFEAEVRMLIDYGNKIEAIRIVREKLGLDLKDAKDLVDRMEQGEPIPAADHAHANDADHEVRQLVGAGRLIEAIKRVREQKGLDLNAAKAYVERL